MRAFQKCSAVQSVLMERSHMRSSLLVLMIISIIACSGHAESFDDPVTSIQVSKDGLFRPGFMYWYVPYGLFLYPSEFVLFGSVTDVTEEPEPEYASDIRRGPIFSGHIQVKAVICCPPNLRESAERISGIECEGFDELEVGDNILVFMVPYEGAFAVPNRSGTNSRLGYRLPDSFEGGPFEPDEFLDLLARGNTWDIGSLTPDQLRLWYWVDPRSVAEALVREREPDE